MCVFIKKEAGAQCFTFRATSGGTDELVAGESHLRSQVGAEPVWSEPNAVEVPVGGFLKNTAHIMSHWDLGLPQ